MKIGLFVIGAQKAGTTAFHHLLGLHPEICMSSPKELHLFDRDTALESQRIEDAVSCAFAGRTDRTRVLGESTPAYCFFPGSLDRLSRYNPGARIIMLMRHPAYRAFSQWRMEVARKVERESFHFAISPEGRSRIHACSENHRAFSYVERGFYADQIANLLARFPRRHCLFVRTDMLWSDPGTVTESVCRFLGVEPIRVCHVPRLVRPVRVDTRMAIARDDLERLIPMYRDDVLRAGRLTALPLEDWLMPGYVEPMRDDDADDVPQHRGQPQLA